MKKAARYITILFLIAFGLLSLFLTSSVIFDLFGIRAKEGNYVLFIVWANFISALLYLSAAYGLIKQQRWPAFALGASFLILIIAFIGLKSHISEGLAYEVKTVSAMIFRISITLVLTILAYFTIDRYKIKN
jgi:hypothetical protein